MAFNFCMARCRWEVTALTEGFPMMETMSRRDIWNTPNRSSAMSLGMPGWISSYSGGTLFSTSAALAGSTAKIGRNRGGTGLALAKSMYVWTTLAC